MPSYTIYVVTITAEETGVEYIELHDLHSGSHSMQHTLMVETSYTPTFKAQVVQELLKETKTLTQLATEHNVHPNVLWEWQRTVLVGLPTLFTKADSMVALRAAHE